MRARRQNKNFFYAFVLPISLLILFVSSSFAQSNHSRAAVIVDVSTGKVLWAKNPNRPLPPASTVKLMTAIVAIEKTELTRVVTISHRAALAQPLKAGFKEGDRLTVEDLLYAALLKSANDAAVALAEGVAGSEDRFVRLMNQKAKEIGAAHTKFTNATGLPGPRQYITATDLSKIMSYALGYPKLREIIGTPVAEFSTEKGTTLLLQSTNKLLWSDEDLIGGKTGFTLRAGHCFVCAAEREKEVIIVAVLGSPSRKRLWAETKELIDRGFQMVSSGRPAISKL